MNWPAGFDPWSAQNLPEYDESVIDPDRVREDHRLKFNFKCISVKLVDYARIEITIKDIEN